MAAPIETPFDRLTLDPGDEMLENDPLLGPDDDEEAPEADDLDDLEDTPLDMSPEEIVSLLNSFFDEAENARETGFEPRHEVWEQNLHAFWMRREYDDKMSWQAREQSTMVPNFVERFAAQQAQALSEASDWAQVEDRHDETGELSRFATALTRIALDFAGTNDSGHAVPFEAIFGGLVQTGALMKMLASVTWDARAKRVVVTPLDPRQSYHDPTGRGLYRVRFWEVDKETLLQMADEVDDAGEPVWDKEAIEALVAHHEQDIVQDREVSSGAGQDLPSPRTPILLKEWLVDLIDKRGEGHGERKVRERQLIVTANDHHIIRGPEKNPYWHGKDWIVSHALLKAPFASVDGRTYVELFRKAVETHENVVNRILDAVSTNSMNAFEVNPDVLDDPSLLEGGIAPNQTFFRAENAPPGEQAIRPIEMGRPLTSDVMRVYSETKRDAQEAGAQSDLSLGQTAKGETTATEASLSSEGQETLNGSMSIGIDLNFLGTIIELVYMTALQHVDEKAVGIYAALSPAQQKMLLARRDEFRARPISVRARGLTQSVVRRRQLRGLLGALNVIGGNPLLVQSFTQEYSLNSVIRLMLQNFGVPIDEIALSEEEKFRRAEEQRMAKAKQESAAALGGGVPGGAEPGSPPQTAQNQGGPDPLVPGAAEGLPGGLG